MHAVAGSARAREMRMSVDILHFVNERGTREVDLVALGKLQLAASRTFISPAYRIRAHRGTVYCSNA